MKDKINNMKQHITVEQFLELTSKQKKNYRKYFKPQSKIIETDMGGNLTIRSISIRGIHLPLISISQMIEFLDEKHFQNWSYIIKRYIDKWEVKINDNEFINDELCDALWEAIKELL